MLAQSHCPERSRMDTRDAQGQTYAGPVPLIRGARGRTREMLRDKISWHSFSAKSARGRTREMLRAPGVHCLAAHQTPDGCAFSTHFATGPSTSQTSITSNTPSIRRPNRPARGKDVHAQVGIHGSVQLLHREVLHDCLICPQKIFAKCLRNSGPTQHEPTTL